MNKIKALLQNEKLAPLIQFIKFGLVGVSNTAISYGIEMLCYYVLFKNSKFIGILNLLSQLGISTDGNNVRIVITTIIAFVVSVSNSYFWNNRYVFKAGNTGHLRRLLKTFLAYGATYLLGLLILYLFPSYITCYFLPFIFIPLYNSYN